MLALIAAGNGIYPVGAQAERYYARPDISYIPLRDTPPFEWGLAWHAGRETSRLRALRLAARSASGEYPQAQP